VAENQYVKGCTVLSQAERFQEKKDRVRKRLVKYTREAFQMLPRLDKPRILDVGCGTGVTTMEMARLSNGEIIALDINQDVLEVLNRKIEKEKISHRVKAIQCSIFDMEFSDESFDIIWAEGSIYVIGFQRGLREWKRFLKPNGFLVVHDEKGNIEEKRKQISSCGYELLGYFILDEDTWRAEYFAPLEKLIGEARTGYAYDPKALEEINQAQREIDMFEKNPEGNSSVCFIMKKS
jgi:ubiquinone/menaquinone biosynthesis C-methylase UbiE